MKIKKILFINFTEDTNINRGVGYISGVILAANYDLEYKELPFKQNYKKWIINSIVDFDVILITANSVQYKFANYFVNQCKEAYINIPILIGGLHPTILGKQLLEDNKNINYIFICEGESMILEFFKSLENNDFTSVPNLIYRSNNKIHTNNMNPAQDLTKLPKFPWTIFSKESVVQASSGFIYVNATRGCSYNCTYCCNKNYLKTYGKSYLRKRPIQDVIDELNYLKKNYNPKLFYFGDELSLFDPEYAIELFSEIKKKVNVPYGLMTRARNLNNNVLDTLAHTNCQYIAMGVECGDENFRKKVLYRNETNQEIIDTFDKLNKLNIYTVSFNMIGFPMDNDSALTQKTFEFNLKIQPSYSKITIYYPFPGTKLGNYCFDNNLVDMEKYERLTDYTTDSILKGYSLEKTKNDIKSILNKDKLSFKEYLKQLIQD